MATQKTDTRNGGCNDKFFDIGPEANAQNHSVNEDGCLNSLGTSVPSVRFRVVEDIIITWDAESLNPRGRLGKTTIELNGVNHALVARLLSSCQDGKVCGEFGGGAKAHEEHMKIEQERIVEEMSNMLLATTQKTGRCLFFKSMFN